MDYRDEELLKKLIIDSVRMLNNTAQTYIRQEIARGRSDGTAGQRDD